MRKGDFTISQPQAAFRVQVTNSEYVGQCRDLYGIYSMLPEHGSWSYDTGESLLRQLEDGADMAILWAALVEDLAALTLALAWKCREATALSVLALNQRALSAAAMTARGAFEAATAAIDHRVRLTVAKAKFAEAGSQQKLFELLNGLENGSIRGLWGRKGGVFNGEVNSYHFFDHQRSVLKYAAQNRQFGPEIVKNHEMVYESLCSMAHPSADGHLPYMVLPWATEPPESTTHIPLVGVPDFRNHHTAVLMESVLWALGWSAAHSCRAWELAEEDRLEAITWIPSGGPVKP